MLGSLCTTCNFVLAGRCTVYTIGLVLLCAVCVCISVALNFSATEIQTQTVEELLLISDFLKCNKIEAHSR